MKNASIIIGVLVIIIAIALITLGISLTGFSIKEQPKETIKIGWIGALTGSTASVGVENLRGVELAIDEINNNGGINGKKVELITQDDQYNPKETINAYQNLESNGIKHIIVETYGGYMALPKQAEKDNVIVIDSIDSTEEMSSIGNNSFAIGVYDESIGYTIADYLNKKGVKNIGVMTDYDDPFPLLVKKSIEKKFTGNINDQDYNLKTTDFRDIITKLKNNPYLILIGWDETGRIVKQANELGYTGEMIGIDTFATENFIKNTGYNYNGLIFTFWQGSQNNPLFKKLVNEYKSKFNKDPDNVLYISTGHDSTAVLINSLNNCDYNNINCVKNSILNTKNFKGASGNITIDQDGITRSIKENMFTYKNGKIVKYS